MSALNGDAPAVLLVDDRTENLLALEAVLAPLPCRTVTAASGEEALRALLQEDFATILLDVQMPGLDGFETAEYVRAARAHPRRADHLRHRRGQGAPARLPGVRGRGRRLRLQALRPRGPARQGRGLPAPARHGARPRAERGGPARRVRLGPDRPGAPRRRRPRAGGQPRPRRAAGARAARPGRPDPGLARRARGRRARAADRAALLAGRRGPYDQELRLVSAGGEAIPCLASFSLAQAPGQEDAVIAQVQDLRERRRAEAEREALVREQAAREEAERAAGRLRAVQRLSDAALAARTVDAVARELLLRVGEVVAADAAAVVLPRDDDAATVHRIDGSVRASLRTTTEPPPSCGPGRAALTDGAAAALDDVTGEAPGAHPLGEAVRALLVVPLRADGEVVGVLFAGSLLPGAFGPEDAAVLALAADRTGPAIERLRRFEEEHAIATRLQRSLSPAELPRLPGLFAAARYRPGGPSATEVGGDWYDAVPVAGGGLLLVMGDVAGRGVGAAAMMGQLRSAIRAYALLDPSPATVLDPRQRLPPRHRQRHDGDGAARPPGPRRGRADRGQRRAPARARDGARRRGPVGDRRPRGAPGRARRPRLRGGHGAARPRGRPSSSTATGSWSSAARTCAAAWPGWRPPSSTGPARWRRWPTTCSSAAGGGAAPTTSRCSWCGRSRPEDDHSSWRRAATPRADGRPRHPAALARGLRRRPRGGGRGHDGRQRGGAERDRARARALPRPLDVELRREAGTVTIIVRDQGAWRRPGTRGPRARHPRSCARSWATCASTAAPTAPR